MLKLEMCLCIEAVVVFTYLASQVATHGGTFCSLIYGVAFHDLVNKGDNVSFSPYLDQLTKGVVFSYSLLYLTERIVHAATVTNCYGSV